MPLRVPFTVDGENGDEERYRVYAEPDRFGGGVTVVAAPLTDVDAALSRLLLLEALVIAGVLLILGLVAWVVVRVGLLPLDRIGHTAGAIAGGDLSHRVESTDPRSEVGRLGIAFNAMLDRLEGAFFAAPGERGPAAPLPRRRLARAAHAAGVDPRVRRAVPDGRGARRRRTSRSRCGGSRTRRRGWACSSRTC